MRRPGKLASDRLHEAGNYAVVTINGKNHDLGRYGSTERQEKNHRQLAKCLAGTPAPAADEPFSPQLVGRNGPQVQTTAEEDTYLAWV